MSIKLTLLIKARNMPENKKNNQIANEAILGYTLTERSNINKSEKEDI